MKKLLLLLLLPVVLMAQEEEKPRKLFLELKQGLVFPSLGLKFKTQNGNYWNVGVNTRSVAIRLFWFHRIGKGDDYIFPLGVYANHEIKKKKMTYTIGGQTVLASKPDEYDPVYKLTFSPSIGVFYGNKLSLGIEVIGPRVDGSATPYFTPLVRLKL